MSKEVTIGICAHNEDRNIGNLLDNILNAQGLAPKSEVLIVCSGCTDKTVEIAQKYAAKDPRIVLFVENERRGKASAVNKILENAKGTNIIFISADTLPTKGCFARLISRLHVPDVGIVCGKPVPMDGQHSLLSKIVSILWISHDHVFKEMNDAGLARHASEMFCIRKGIIDKIPSEIVNDDAYLAVIAKKKGWFIKYEPKACVTISGPKTFLDYLQQRRRVIYGHYQLMRLTGEFPQYLVCLVLLHPMKALKSGLWLCAECGITSILPFALIEILLNIVAAIDLIRHKSFSKWTIAPSTKTLSLDISLNPLDSSKIKQAPIPWQLV